MKLNASEAGIQDISFLEGQVIIRLTDADRIDRALLRQGLGDELKIGTSQIRLDIRRAGKGWKRSLERVVDLTARAMVVAHNGAG